MRLWSGDVVSLWGKGDGMLLGLGRGRRLVHCARGVLDLLV